MVAADQRQKAADAAGFYLAATALVLSATELLYVVDLAPTLTRVWWVFTPRGQVVTQCDAWLAALDTFALDATTTTAFGPLLATAVNVAVGVEMDTRGAGRLQLRLKSALGGTLDVQARGT